ncbi:protein STRUBBELIG-RECEPTOR FAMILY 7 [Prunus yedoensis var. nudiflora]|uniref:Protein STRUBBELIG-RECEPTOR FAMILY 7 n=1 Tax=Prunus yedoensis var. nudiflora TaxID=2094558 RepID=A0A314XSC5_PRUYE|nr:protein STRUBBELIG-RECEPTOR FAMILY 7 [Prunus yedoensis var. nudiflora]
MLETWRWVWLVFGICILGWSPSSINAATDPNDVSALKALYSSLNSPSQLTQWSASGDDPCGQSWKGVKCSGSRVTEIDVSNHQLSGTLWSSLQSMTALTNLDMSHNNLQGSIPYSLPPNMTRLNLAGNNFNQGIPYSISLITSLEYLNISHNQLQNQVDDIFGKLSSLSTLDLSFNSLSGNLPESLSSLSSMTTMYLQNNQLTGTINVLANLPLENLNIQNNQFTGWIPEQLKNINLEKDGNQWNSGPAPPPPPGTPPATKNNGNHKSGSNGSSSKGGAGEGGKKSGIGGGGIAGIVISLLVVTGVVAFFIIKRRSRRSSSDVEKFDSQPFAPLASEVKEMKSVQTPATLDMKTFDTPATINLRPPPMDRHKSFDEEDFSKKPIVVKKTSTAPLNVTSYSIADLQIATGSFNVENLLGEGLFGRVYRAQFDDGKVLAVKKIDSSVLPSELSEDFTEIVSNISQLHHPNVTELVGYCSEHGQHLLVYEFHKSGSLHDFLHLSDDYNKPLAWNSRVKIALGTARALEECQISMTVQHEQALEHNAGSGYSAPEVAMSGQYTLKSDVYGFGVVMLELISGRKPFDSSKPRSEQSLVRWATPQLHDIDALSKMVDPALKGLYPVKSLSRFADVIALCVQPEPEFRPPMSEVVEALVRLVQRANMSRRTVGNDQGGSQRGDNANGQDDMS